MTFFFYNSFSQFSHSSSNESHEQTRFERPQRSRTGHLFKFLGPRPQNSLFHPPSLFFLFPTQERTNRLNLVFTFTSLLLLDIYFFFKPLRTHEFSVFTLLANHAFLSLLLFRSEKQRDLARLGNCVLVVLPLPEQLKTLRSHACV